MKSNIKLLCFLLVCLSGIPNLYAEADNDTIIRSRYTFYFKEDTVENRRYQADSSMLLDIDGTKAAFYSEEYYLKHIAIENYINIVVTDAGITVSAADGYVYRYTEASRYFINYGDGTYSKYDNSMENYFAASGRMEIPIWEFEDTTTVVCGHLCQRAVTDYLGRKWIAWYAPSIPVPAGPWLLWGLPGLILRAGDSEGLFVFEAKETGLAVSAGEAERMKEISDDQYRLIRYPSIEKMEKDFNHVKRSYYADCAMAGRPDEYMYDYIGGIKTLKFPDKPHYIPVIPDEYWKRK